MVFREMPPRSARASSMESSSRSLGAQQLGCFPPETSKSSGADTHGLEGLSWLRERRSDSMPWLIVPGRYRPVQLWNHIDGGRTIIASVEYPQMRALQARRTVKRFATRCNVRGVPLRGPRPAVLVVSCDNPGA